MRKKTAGLIAVRHRSSLTGRFVSKNYALKHRGTTEKERIKSAKRKRR